MKENSGIVAGGGIKGDKAIQIWITAFNCSTERRSMNTRVSSNLLQNNHTMVLVISKLNSFSFSNSITIRILNWKEDR